MESTENQTNLLGGGYYAFVTFYSAMSAIRAKEDLNSVLLLEEHECKVELHTSQYTKTGTYHDFPFCVF